MKDKVMHIREPEDGNYKKLFETMTASGYATNGKLWIIDKGIKIWPHGKY